MDMNKYPVTIVQESILLHEEYMWNLGLPARSFLVHSALVFEGLLNVAALEQALNSVIERHAGLRAAFMKAGIEDPLERELKICDLANDNACATGMYTQYLADNVRLQIHTHFIDPLDPEEKEIEIENILINSSKIPFNYFKPPFIKAHHFQLSHDNHLLVIMMHHLICDMPSFAIFGKDLATFYSSSLSKVTPQLPIIKRHYLDFALEQYECATNGGFDKSIQYWKDQLIRYRPTGIHWDDLPSSFRGSVDTRSSETGTVVLPLDCDLMQLCEIFIRKAKLTLFMLYIAACMILFKKLGKNEAVTISSFFANRTNMDYLNAIGYFSNQHILSAEFSDDSTGRDILSKVRIAVANAIANQNVPISLVVNKIGFMPGESGIQLFCDMVKINSSEDTQYKNIVIKGLPAPEYLLGIGKHKLMIRLWHSRKDSLLSVVYPADKIGSDGALRILNEIKNIMAWCVDNENDNIANYKLLNT
jgi:hypothetical protein